MKRFTMFALALVAGFLLASCGGSSVGDDGTDDTSSEMTCTPQCDDKECGMDGCGGICGGCPGDQVCDAGGHCVEPCVAKCTGKECGDDGCGSTCGSCAQGETCSATGQCVGGCVPACGGKECGPDGCNGTCGSCSAHETCSAAGLCQGACTPDCAGKQCGPDGCNGSCGACGNGQTCGDDGQCEGECVPACGGKECGTDGCGGTCGACGQGETCTMAGLCQGTCTPDCGGKQCGADGCGGSCGTCGNGQTCTMQGQCDGTCAPNCAGLECGTDGCGGSCGTCGASETCTDGVCTGGGTGDWTCDPSYFDDGEFCDCDCGTADPDCDLPDAQVFGCDPGQTCEAGVCTGGGTGDWTCAPSYFDDGEFCDCDCGAYDPDCDVSGAEVYGCDPGQTCDPTGQCTGAVVDNCNGVPWEGCCAGDVLTYCESGELVTVACSDVGPGAVCGWYAGDDTYDPAYNCGPASALDQGGDPSGTFPMACGGACVPACDGKVCGDDGCGGTCGTCATGGCDDHGQCVDACGDVTYEGCCVGAKLVYCLEGQITEMVCNETNPEAICGWFAGSADYPFGYYCGPETTPAGDPLLDPDGDPSGVWPLTCAGACVPACTGKACGDDGCGGTCGTCAPGETCTAGLCQGTCVPACTGKACGDDGCGGTCGTCSGDNTCVAGACVAPCDRTGFTVEGDAAAYDPDAQLLVYAAYQTSNPADYLSFELWQRFGGPTTPGSYVLTDENYETCSTCLLIDTDCTATECQKTFLAVSGGVDLADLGVVGDFFTGTLTDVKLVEVTIDPDTYVSTPVPGGETWCLDSLSFDMLIDAWPSN